MESSVIIATVEAEIRRDFSRSGSHSHSMQHCNLSITLPPRARTHTHTQAHKQFTPNTLITLYLDKQLTPPIHRLTNDRQAYLTTRQHQLPLTMLLIQRKLAHIH